MLYNLVNVTPATIDDAGPVIDILADVVHKVKQELFGHQTWVIATNENARPFRIDPVFEEVGH